MSAQLPIFLSDDQPMVMMQNKWASAINPLLRLPLNNPSLLQDISLSTGANTINHKLGRTPIGYLVIDTNASVTIYRSAALNNKTLTLTSSGAAVISLLVF